MIGLLHSGNAILRIIAYLREFWPCWLLIAAALLLNQIPWLGPA